MTLTEFRDQLTGTYSEFVETLQDDNIIDTSILNSTQYSAATRVSADSLAVFYQLYTYANKRNVHLNPATSGHEIKNKVAFYYYTYSAKLLIPLLTHPGLAAIISEIPQSSLRFPKSFIGQLIDRTRAQFKTQNQGEISRRSGSLADLLERNIDWLHNQLPNSDQALIDHALYIMDNARLLNASRYKGRVIDEVWTDIKSSLLFLTGKVYIPKHYFISVSQLNAVQPSLQPADIAVIKHELKLTNIAFRGEWSHSLIYLGTWRQMSEFFDSDRETNRYAREQCRKRGLQCQRFSTYLENAYPKVVAYFKSTESFKGTPLSRVVLESRGEGVIISNLYRGLLKDQLAMFRARMKKVAKARVVEKALSYVFRPYDYDFSLHSRRSLVCTEIIYNAFDPSVGPGVPEFHWQSQHTVLGNPISYATDLVKTFADQYGSSHQNLDFLFFYKGNKRTGSAQWATVDELIQSVR